MAKKVKEKNKGGRPTDYKPEYTRKALKLARLGATDKEIADFFEVSEPTLNAWKKKYPEFFKSLKQGKIESDLNVSNSLYKRALGYKTKVDKIFQYEGSPVIVPTVEKYPPDPTSMIFWLKNRRPDLWRDKQEVQHSGEVTHNISETKFSLKVKK